MDIKKLQEIIAEHRGWLNNEPGCKRADLRSADLQGADLRGADMDYTSWPLWCGSLYAYIDDHLARQLLYHLLYPVMVSPYVSKEIKDALLTEQLASIANQFHRANECGRIVLQQSAEHDQA